MAIDLQDFNTGDTDYIAKMNNNNTVLENAINALQAATSGPGGTTTGSKLEPGLSSGATTLIGTGSYKPSGSGATLTVAAGYAFRASSQAMVQSVGPVNLDFTGQGAATYYVDLDTAGVPIRASSSGVDTVYSVVWTGAAFGAITRVAQVLFDGTDETAALSSYTNDTVYLSLDARLEAIEASVGDVDLSGYQATSEKGQPNGYASLGGDGKVPSGQLPTISSSYDPTLFYPGKPGSNELLHRIPVVRQFTLPASLTGSKGISGVAPSSGDYVITVKKKGVAIGTITFANGSTTPTFAAASPTTFDPANDDYLDFVAPAGADATLADIAVTLKGTTV